MLSLKAAKFSEYRSGSVRIQPRSACLPYLQPHRVALEVQQQMDRRQARKYSAPELTDKTRAS